MAKKKSEHSIIPSINFITTIEGPKKKDDEIEQEPKVVEQTPPKEVRLKLNTKRSSALSLSSIKRKKDQEESARQQALKDQGKVEQLPSEAFNADQFFEVWDAYLADLHVKGEKLLASILKADRPKLKGAELHMTYPNQLMKAELLKVRPKVLRHLRSALSNHQIDFVVEVNEEHTKKFAYTPQEKYELLKEKNANLGLLRKKFNLEL